MTAIPSLREVSCGLYGAWRLARLDTTAMAWFDRGPDGTARSFWAAIICFPGFVALLALRVTPHDWASSGVAHILLVESIGYVVGWAAYPLAVLLFAASWASVAAATTTSPPITGRRFWRPVCF